MEKENVKKVLERASRLKEDMSLTQRKPRPVGSVSELDHMIANLGNPRMAEKLRIHKVGEGKFGNLVVKNVFRWSNHSSTKSRKR